MDKGEKGRVRRMGLGKGMGFREGESRKGRRREGKGG